MNMNIIIIIIILSDSISFNLILLDNIEDILVFYAGSMILQEVCLCRTVMMMGSQEPEEDSYISLRYRTTLHIFNILYIIIIIIIYYRAVGSILPLVRRVLVEKANP